jgi:hypothetical protein
MNLDEHPDFVQRVTALREARAARDAWDELQKKLAEALRVDLEMLGFEEGIEDTLTIRRSVRSSIDTTSLRERFPEIARVCMRETEVVSVVLK